MNKKKHSFDLPPVLMAARQLVSASHLLVSASHLLVSASHLPAVEQAAPMRLFFGFVPVFTDLDLDPVDQRAHANHHEQ
ncbi:MAG: hypothetical protein HPY85_07590 [Anaerolineae bacterium]|nr:hypothetical protein [Anaerolineae bacterium]